MSGNISVDESWILNIWKMRCTIRNNVKAHKEGELKLVKCNPMHTYSEASPIV